MTNNHVNKSLLGTYKIRDMIVDIYFSPKVIETYASDEEIYKLNNIKDFQKADFKNLENHFENIFKIIKERVLEFRTYTMYFDTIEYQNIELIWSSGCDHELKLMEVDVSYSQMNDPKYLESIAEEVNAFNEAQENGEDMQDWIEKRREEDKDSSKPKIIGSVRRQESVSVTIERSTSAASAVAGSSRANCAFRGWPDNYGLGPGRYPY